MEAIDWDVYAKSYDDTQHLVGRPDLAQKHYDLIGRDQGRDPAFNALLLALTNSECPDESAAKSWYLSHPDPSHLCRSRRSLMGLVSNDPVLFGLLPSNSDYLVGPAVDEALFSLYLERTPRPLDDLIRMIVERITEELIGDVSLSAPATGQQNRLATPTDRHVSSQANNGSGSTNPVVQRPSVIRRSSLRDFLLEVDSVVTLADGKGVLILGVCLDPDSQIQSIQISAAQLRIDVGRQVVRFNRPARARELQSRGLANAVEQSQIGFALLLRGDLLNNDSLSALHIQNQSGVTTKVDLSAAGLESLDMQDLASAWFALHHELYEVLDGEMSSLPSVWLEAILPQQTSFSNRVQFGIQALHVFHDRLLMYSSLRDPQLSLKSLYWKNTKGALVNLAPHMVRAMTRADEHGPLELLLVNLKADPVLGDAIQILGLQDDGQWFRIDHVALSVSSIDVLRQLEEVCKPLHGYVLDGIFREIVDPIADRLFIPQSSKNPAYRIQALGHHVVQGSPIQVSALVQAEALDNGLLALLSSLDKQQRLGTRIEVLLGLRTLPSHNELKRFMAQLKWFGLDVRIYTTPSANVFSNMVNQLSRYASGDYLLIMTADALPASVAWLRSLLSGLSEKVGAVFPLFLNVGGTIEHGGQTFCRHPVDGSWITENPLRSLPLERVQHVGAYDVPFGLIHMAVVRRKDFENLDGLDESVPDFELCSMAWCMKVWDKGLASVVDSRVIAQLRRPTEILNSWSYQQIGHVVQTELSDRYRQRVLNERWGAIISRRYADWSLGLGNTEILIENKRSVSEILKGLT